MTCPGCGKAELEAAGDDGHLRCPSCQRGFVEMDGELQPVAPDNE